MKNYKKGDSVLCIRSVNFYHGIIFQSGSYYIISDVSKVYYTIDGVSFLRFQCGVDDFSYYFGSLQEARRYKLNELKKIYE